MGKTNELDKFYTAPHLASKCVDEFNEHVNICDGDVVIEPSAGDGSFARFFWTKESLQFDAYDLAPEHNDIKKQDFPPPRLPPPFCFSCFNWGGLRPPETLFELR